MKKNKTYIPANKDAEAKKKEIKLRLAVRRKERLIRQGLSEDKLKEILKSDKNKIIMCLLYGNYTVDLGTRKTKSKNPKEVKNILSGKRAAVYTLGKNKVTILAAKGNYVVVQSDESSMSSHLEMLEKMGRCCVNTWQPTQPNEKKKSKKTIKQKKKAVVYYKLRKKKKKKTLAKVINLHNNNKLKQAA